jgi:integrase
VDVCYQGKRVQRQCATEIEAAQVEAQLLVELKAEAEGTTAKAAKAWTLGQAVERTLERVWRGTKAERTSTINANILLRYFGKTRPLDTITEDTVDAFVKHLKAGGNANGTINRKLACLSKVLTVAVERKGLKPDLKPKLELEKEYQGRIRYLSPEEETTVLALLGQWEKPDHVDAIQVLVDVGMRMGELFKIQKRDCNFQQRMVSLWERKGGLPNSIPMTTRVTDILKRRCEGLKDDALVFPFDVWWMRNQWDRVKGHMGLNADEDFVPHCLRHTCASRLVQRGVPLKAVQEILGHASITVTQRYAHLAPGNLTDAMKALEPQTKTGG